MQVSLMRSRAQAHEAEVDKAKLEYRIGFLLRALGKEPERK